jgi:hypothetical protein
MAKLTKAQAQAQQAEFDALADIATSEQNLAPAGDDALVSAHNALALRFAELEKRFAALENQSAPAPAIVAPTSTPAVKPLTKAQAAKLAKAEAEAKASAPAPTSAPKAPGTLRMAKTAAESKRLRTAAGASNSTRYVCSCGISGFHAKFANKHIAKGHDIVQVGA